MMKTYIIHVNGQRYEVTVEEKREGSGVSAAGAPVARVEAAPAAAAPPAPAAAPSPAAAPAAKAAAGNGNVITAPLPGKVVAVKVKAGAAVKKGQVLMVLEAMKMENEIVAPADGKVKEVHVSEGASVNVGEPLISLA